MTSVLSVEPKWLVQPCGACWLDDGVELTLDDQCRVS